MLAQLDTGCAHGGSQMQQRAELFNLILPSAPIYQPPTSLFFGLLKDAVRGRSFAEDDELKLGVGE